MHTTEDQKVALPDKLLKQIEKLCVLVKEIQGETAVLVKKDNVSDATAHLQDVLKSTEEATNKIIDAVMAIQNIADNGKYSAEDKQHISEHIAKVYEACNFQDITGQQIKKVLGGLESLQVSIIKLAETAKGYHMSQDEKKVAPEEQLLNGPQLSKDAPNQEKIDHLFKTL